MAALHPATGWPHSHVSLLCLHVQSVVDHGMPLGGAKEGQRKLQRRDPMQKQRQRGERSLTLLQPSSPLRAPPSIVSPLGRAAGAIGVCACAVTIW